MSATSRTNASTFQLMFRTATALIAALLAVGTLSVGVAGAQSSGCTGGPFAGATALDSDGDGVSDGNEVLAGTDECDPASTPVEVCGSWVATYTAATADSDSDGVTDAAEIAAGTDECASASTPTQVCGSYVASYNASTADTDGDGVTDAAETAAGTDECASSSTPTEVCGSYVASYSAATADTDGDGETDATETSGGSDPCLASSTVAGAAAANNTTTTTTTAAAADDSTAEAPTLALTGPSTSTIIALIGAAMLMLGCVSTALGRRVEA